jgi:predicted dehydrogenase
VYAEVGRRKAEHQPAAGFGARLASIAAESDARLASIAAGLDARLASIAADDDVFLALRHIGGATSHLRMSELAPEPAPRFRVTGSLGTYRKEGTDPQESSLRAGDRPDNSPDWGREPAEYYGVLNTGERTRRVPTEPGDYPGFYRRVVAALTGAGPLPVTLESAIRVIEVIEAAYRCGRSGFTELGPPRA